MTPGFIIGFKATGICPINALVTLECGYAPLYITELENGNEEDSNTFSNQKKSVEREQSTSAEPMNESSAKRIKMLLHKRSSKYQDVSSESDNCSNYSIHEISDNEDMTPIPTVTFEDTTSKVSTSFTGATPKIKTKKIQRGKA